MTPRRYDLDKIKSEIRITDYAQSMGYTLTKVGNYYSLAEHDSVRIDDRKNCFWRNSRFAQGQKANTTAGSIIDFVMHFEGKDFKSALETLVSYSMGNYMPSTFKPTTKPPKPKKPFALPLEGQNCFAVIDYLVNRRGIDKDIVAEYIEKKMIYQDKRNNAVFVGYNADGKADFACFRGTYPGKRFIGDVESSNYNTCIFINNNSNTLVVTESVIDSLSYMSVLKAHGLNYNDYSYNALSATTKIAAVLNNLKAHDNINAVIIALDNDKAGINAGERLKTMLREAGWQGRILKHYPKHKDWDWNNELLNNKQSLDKVINGGKTMTKYKVENTVSAPKVNEPAPGIAPWTEVRDNYVGDYIEAETPEIAVEYAIDYLVEQIRNNGFDAEADYDKAEIIVSKNRELHSLYFGFTAKEIEIDLKPSLSEQISSAGAKKDGEAPDNTSRDERDMENER